MKRERIQQRRAQMLIHSYAYYVLDAPMVSDDTWQRWANELVALQAEIPDVKIGFYDHAFGDWDGSTGMHLPQDRWVRNKAWQIAATLDRVGPQKPPEIVIRAAPALLEQGSLF